MIYLQKARQEDSQLMQEMIQKAFARLLEHYRDYNTNPACESVDSIRNKINTSDYYFIVHDKTRVGGIRIVQKEGSCRISPIFILPEYRRRGYARLAISAAENMHNNVSLWQLDTIKQEEQLVHMYESMGYLPNGREYKIKDGMTIIYMEKKIKQ